MVCGTAEYRTSGAVQENDKELNAVKLLWRKHYCPILSYKSSHDSYY